MKTELENLAGVLESQGLEHESLRIRSYAAITSDDLLNISHVILDGLGLVPGYGEAADLSNALLYVTRGTDRENLINAGFSIASCIPELGDAIAKIIKYARKVSKEVLSAAIELIFKHQSEIQAVFSKLKSADVAAMLQKLPGGSILVEKADQFWPLISSYLQSIMTDEMKAEII